MTFYDRMTALAERFTTGEFFADATLTRKSASAFDPITGTVTGGTTTTPCRAVATLITTKADNGALVSHTMLILDLEPKADDQITIGSDTYTVGQIMTVKPAGTAIIYRALAK